MTDLKNQQDFYYVMATINEQLVNVTYNTHLITRQQSSMYKHMLMWTCNYTDTLYPYPIANLRMLVLTNLIDYEPADLTVHLPLQLPSVCLFFSYRCLVFPKNVI